MQNGTMIKLTGEPAYLSPGYHLGWTDAILTCSDGVRLKASTATMAAVSGMLHSILRQGTCCDGDTAEIHVGGATSEKVLKVLHFMHTGCLYSPSPEPPPDTLELFRAFGINLSAVKLSPHPQQEDIPDLSCYYLDRGTKPLNNSALKIVKKEVLEDSQNEFCDNENLYSCEVQLKRVSHHEEQCEEQGVEGVVEVEEV